MDRTGLPRSSIYEGMAKGTFPAQMRLSPDSKRSPVAWLESEIESWQAARIAARPQRGGA
jgi:prophage regulatory protein